MVLLPEDGQRPSLGCRKRKFLVTTSRVGAQGLSPARAELRWIFYPELHSGGAEMLSDYVREHRHTRTHAQEKYYSRQKWPSKPHVNSRVCNWTQYWPWQQRMSALPKCSFPSLKEKEATGCAFKCLQYIISCRTHDRNLRHGLCPENVDSFIMWQFEHIKDN